MARPPLLKQEALHDWLGSHDRWTLDGVLLKRTLQFENFSEAFSFMTRVALVAEKLDHHPEWSNVYNTVELAVTTHDVGGLTRLDTAFAAAVDEILGEASL